MVKKAVIAVAIAAVVLLASAGFTYAYNNDRQEPNQAAYTNCLSNQDQALCVQNRHEYRYLYNQEDQDCQGQRQQLRKQERLIQDGQCQQPQQECNQLGPNQSGRGRAGGK